MLLFALLALVISPSDSTESATAGLSSSGVPCYLHPAADGCHYTLRPGSDSCTTPSEKKRLSAGILLVNRTLTSLEQQLIRLGVSKDYKWRMHIIMCATVSSHFLGWGNSNFEKSYLLPGPFVMGKRAYSRIYAWAKECPTLAGNCNCADDFGSMVEI